MWGLNKESWYGSSICFDGLKTAPLLAPDYGETAMKLDDSFGLISMSLQAVAYLANTANSISTKIDNVLPCGWFCVLTNIIRIQYKSKTLKNNPNIRRMVGDSLGKNAPLELPKNHQDLSSWPNSDAVVDVAFRPNPNTEIDSILKSNLNIWYINEYNDERTHVR